MFLYHEPTGAINLPSAWVFTFFRLCCVAFRLYFVRWAYLFFLMNIWNNFNRCLRGKSLQCSLLSSTWAVDASVLWYTLGVWAGGKAQKRLVSSFLTIVTVIPSWYLYFLSSCQQKAVKSSVGTCNGIIILYWHMVCKWGFLATEELKDLFIAVGLNTVYLLPSRI